MIGGGKVPDLSLNYIFDALSIGVQHIPSISINQFSSFEEIFYTSFRKIHIKDRSLTEKYYFHYTFSLRDFKMKKWNLYTFPTQTYKK